MAPRGTGAGACDPDGMNLRRVAARGVVLLGGAFWVVAAFAGHYAFQRVQLPDAIGSALVPLALTAIVFAIGWLSEVTAAIVLYVLSTGGAVWGSVAGWEPVVWLLMLTFFLLPMVAAATLYWQAWRMEAACGGAERSFSLLSTTDSSPR